MSESVRPCSKSKSICRDGEIHGDASLGFYRTPALVVRLEVPLLHRLAGSGRKNRRPAEDLYVLNAAAFADQSLQHDCTLDFHLLGKKRVARAHAAGNHSRRAR